MGGEGTSPGFRIRKAKGVDPGATKCFPSWVTLGRTPGVSVFLAVSWR